ncbi:MAG TPA: hypothetical protein VD978_29485 [Azospirillum sp.]|nr:hypothetical protein [Azospirillum sp.]
MASAPALSAPAPEADLATRVRQLEQMLLEQGRRISQQEKRLAQQERTIAQQQKALERQRGTPNTQPREAASTDAPPPAATPAQPSRAAAPPAPAARPQPASAPSTQPTATQPTATQPKRNEPAVLEQLTDIRGVLLPRGGLVVEPGLEYIHSSSRRVEIAGFSVLPAIVIGEFDLRKTSRNTLIGSLTSRYGLTDRLELEAKLPYIYRSDRTTGRPVLDGGQQDVSTSATGHDIGDVEFAAHYQINQGASEWPYFVGNLRLRAPTGTHPFEVRRDPLSNLELKLPTGTGFWGIEPSLTMLVPSDPMVFYTNLSYLYNMKRSFGGGTGTIDPGDAYGFSFGGAFAMNERSSFSLGGDFQLVRPTTQNGRTVQGSENLYIGRGVLGFTQRVSDSTAVNLNFTFGITEDAPDLHLGVKVPLTLY